MPAMLDAAQLLAELDAEGRPLALTRIAKRLGRPVSELLRGYTALGPAVVLACEEDKARWTVRPAATVRPFTVQRQGASERDQIAVETPVALVFNGVSHAVMMATPADLEAFALGFALSEGLLLARSECFGIEIVPADEGIEVQLQVAASAQMRLKEQRRNLAGRTGCGLCGIDSLRALDLAPPPLTGKLDVTPAALQRAWAELPARQPLNALTGAHHAAAWATPEGALLDVREDVGRHNALDKLLGARVHAGAALGGGFVLMSSRASSELVLKCARLGVPALATISAPTSLAIELARRSGLQLWGFVRGEQAVLYTP